LQDRRSRLGERHLRQRLAGSGENPAERRPGADRNGAFRLSRLRTVEVRIEKIGEVTVIAPEGTIDSRTAPQFEKPALEALAKGERRIVVDFSKIDFTSSAGLRILLMLGKRL